MAKDKQICMICGYIGPRFFDNRTETVLWSMNSKGHYDGSMDYVSCYRDACIDQVATLKQLAYPDVDMSIETRVARSITREAREHGS